MGLSAKVPVLAAPRGPTRTWSWRLARPVYDDRVMAPTNGKSRTVQVELPGEVFDSHPWDPERIAEDLRLLWLLELVRERRLGHGKAAELAGIPRARFLQIMGRHRISSFDYDPDELDEELA